MARSQVMPCLRNERNFDETKTGRTKKMNYMERSVDVQVEMSGVSEDETG